MVPVPSRDPVRRWAPVIAAAWLLAACSSSPSSPAATSSSSSSGASTATSDAAVGRAFIEALSRQNWSGAQAMEDPTMAAAAGRSVLQQTVAMLVARYGPLQTIGTVTTTPHNPGSIVAVPVVLAHATATLNVSVDAGRVVGLHRGAVVATTTTPAPYVKQGSFTETGVTVGSTPWALPGTPTMPTGTGPFPAVVLVAGSGPADRDETFGPNKPFRDLAWGLASDPTLTVRQETPDDAVLATALLRRTSKVDPARVFLVGHSLGVYLAPAPGHPGAAATGHRAEAGRARAVAGPFRVHPVLATARRYPGLELAGPAHLPPADRCRGLADPAVLLAGRPVTTRCPRPSWAPGSRPSTATIR